MSQGPQDPLENSLALGRVKPQSGTTARFSTWPCRGERADRVNRRLLCKGCGHKDEIQIRSSVNSLGAKRWGPQSENINQSSGIGWFVGIILRCYSDRYQRLTGMLYILKNQTMLKPGLIFQQKPYWPQYQSASSLRLSPWSRLYSGNILS